MQRPTFAPARVRFTRVGTPGGVRVLTHLDASLARDYTHAVVHVAPAVEIALGPEVHANRVERVERLPPLLVLRSWRSEHESLRAALRAMASRGPVVRTDVSACYPSIGPEAVHDALGRAGARARAAARCARVVSELGAEGVQGLPIGPAASAVLANAVLSAGDRALAATGARFVRWVDDWWIEVRSDAHAAEVLDSLGTALAATGLRLNHAKTRMCGRDPLAGRPSTAGYHRAAHADPLPLVAGSDAGVPGDRRMGAGRRAARPAGRHR